MDEELDWHRFCDANGGSCLEVAHAADGVTLMRESSESDVVLRIPTSSWNALRDRLIDGEFH
jgi:uncharacterized protein DUF397